MQLVTSKPIQFSSEKLSSTKLVVKGFGSVSLFDRDSEKVASPFEFNISEFMNSPQLLVNHNYIKTKEGNSVAAGVVKNAIPSYIEKHPTDNKLWVVKSLTDGNPFVSTWLKSKSPRMEAGDQGLFIVAEVDEPFAIEQIEKGKLGAFSWAGLSYKQKKFGSSDLIQDIDVVEFSLSLIHISEPTRPY